MKIFIIKLKLELCCNFFSLFFNCIIFFCESSAIVSKKVFNKYLKEWGQY